MQIYRFVVTSGQNDPRSAGYLKDALALGFNDLQRIQCQDLYFIEGRLQQDEMRQLALGLLSDPVTQTAEYNVMTGSLPERPSEGSLVEVTLRPGVTDPVAGELVRGTRQMGIPGVHRAASGLRFQLKFKPTCPDPTRQAERLAQQLLTNSVIHTWRLGEVQPAFPQEAAPSGEVQDIELRGLGDEGLLRVSQERRAALDLTEMKAIQAYFEHEGRDPTDVEVETLAQTWSEHCVHKSFKARIQLEGAGGKAGQSRVIDSLYATYIKSATQQIKAPWVISAFVDNAGIIAFDDEYEIAFKVETHNHPSAIEPFGGANTGVGGVIRDVLGVSAKPIANTDVLCFGPQDLPMEGLPQGVLHPVRIQSGVVAGVQDYGNKIGIPTVNGAILYDEGYTANPLVFCGCVGLAPRGKHRKQPMKGDRVILLGGKTGRDGLRGATFSSMTMDAHTGQVSGASVQIGDPITEKGLIDVLLQARDQGLYDDITDCGAGGLSSAVGEMAAKTGADVELSQVSLKYPGLAPWEVWLSEAQERMVLAVPTGNLPCLQSLCDTFDTELTDLGQITDSGRLVVRHDGQPVLELDNNFLHHGLPQRKLTARLPEIERSGKRQAETQWRGEPQETLLRLLGQANIASKEEVIRLYDHEIQGGTVVKPMSGQVMDGPSDGCVLKPIGTQGWRGIVLSNGINPEYGKHDPYRMAWANVDEAIRNAVACGADPQRLALLDNFCWGDPCRPETLGSLVEAARGCHEAALAHAAPFISGKDSLNNEYLTSDGSRQAIPPTLLISAVGLIEDVRQALTMDLKEAGNRLYLVGNFQPRLGGSHFKRVEPQAADLEVPVEDPQAGQTYRALHQAMQQGWVRSAHDLSEGGLATAAAEMCIGGRLGLRLDLKGKDGDVPHILFGETNGCLLVEVRLANQANFEQALQGHPLRQLGNVQEHGRLEIRIDGKTLVDLPLEGLVKVWKGFTANQAEAGA